MGDESRQQKRAAARAARKSQQKPAVTLSTPPQPVADKPVVVDDAARARWRAEALGLPEEGIAFGPSMRILLDEAQRCVGFLERRWEPAIDPATKAVRAPGLKGASRHLSRATGAEILELHALAQEAHGQWILATGGVDADPVSRGRFVLGEMQATLQFVADEGGHDELPAQLARVKEAHAKDGVGREDLASALADWGTLAGAYAEALDGVGGFDGALIPEAQALAATLRALPDARQDSADDARAKIDLRNRYASLLFDRVSTLRSVARFVFRHHPKIAREATSAYERNRRAASRRKKKGAKDDKPADPT